MIFMLKFGDVEDGAAFQIWADEEGLDTVQDMGDYEGFGPKNTLIMLTVEEPAIDDFLALWGPFIVSAGIA